MIGNCNYLIRILEIWSRNEQPEQRAETSVHLCDSRPTFTNVSASARTSWTSLIWIEMNLAILTTKR